MDESRKSPHRLPDDERSSRRAAESHDLRQPPVQHQATSPSAASVMHPSDNARSPLDDAVTSAIDHSAMATKVDPHLVAMVTNQVISNLKAAGIDTASGTHARPNPHLAPPRDVYTPPSPTRVDETSLPHIPPLHAEEQVDGPAERRPSFERPFFRESTQTHSRPPAPPRQVSDDATTIERIWQPLFDKDGKPTPRLSQFLKGLAIHIIEAFEPANSLVITPQKMRAFYEQTVVPGEIYPWSAIFGGKITNSSLSHLYRDLKCEHFFVQAGAFDEKPSVPALTPLGFEIWFTHAITSHPDLEWQRFSKAILSLPISNFYDRRERFPKELPRRLFPANTDEPTRMYFEDSILADDSIELLPKLSRETSSASNGASSNTRPPIAKPHFPPPHSAEGLNHQRRSTNSSEKSAEELPRGSISLERERKPYAAMPGQGKQYEEGDTLQRTQSHGLQRSNTHGGRQMYEAGANGPGRTKGRSGSASQAGRNNGRQRVQSPSKNGRGVSYARSEDAVAAGGTHTTDDEESRRKFREAKEQQRALQAREYVMEGVKGHATADASEEVNRRRMSVPVNCTGLGHPPPPSSRHT